MSSSPQHVCDNDKDNVPDTLAIQEQSNDLEELPSEASQASGETETSKTTGVNNSSDDIDELLCVTENRADTNTPNTTDFKLHDTCTVEPNDIHTHNVDESSTISQSNKIKYTETVTAETKSVIDDETKNDIDSCNSAEISGSDINGTGSGIKKIYTRDDFISESSDPEVEEENTSQTVFSDTTIIVDVESDSDREEQDEIFKTITTDQSEAMGNKSSTDVHEKKLFRPFILAVPYVYIKTLTEKTFSLIWFVLWAGVSIFMSVMGSFLRISGGNGKQSKKGTKAVKKGKTLEDFNFSSRKKYSDIDTEMYRRGYPDKRDSKSADKNLRFYKNEIRSKPDGDFIDEIHTHWKGDYTYLEHHHGYIQWLFPIRESGMNWHAQELQLHEAQAIQSDSKTKKRVLKSYEMMLDFYGMRLVDENTGKLERAKASKWKSRFDNLNRSMHNYLRITRILKSLGELGFEHFKVPFIEFIIEQVGEHALNERVHNSCINYWVGTVKDDAAREDLTKKLLEVWDSFNE